MSNTGMRISEMKFGNIMAILSIFSKRTEKPDMLQYMVGKKVLIRDNMSGVYICMLAEINGPQWRGLHGRKIHYWDKAGAVEGIAQTGCDLGSSRLTEIVEHCNGRHQVQVLQLANGIYDTLMSAPVWNPK